VGRGKRFINPLSSPEAERLRSIESILVWNYLKEEMEDMKFGVVLLRRSLSKGEGDGGRGQMNTITESTRVPFASLWVSCATKVK